MGIKARQGKKLSPYIKNNLLAPYYPRLLAERLEEDSKCDVSLFSRVREEVCSQQFRIVRGPMFLRVPHALLYLASLFPEPGN